jgi:hypothetical protein
MVLAPRYRHKRPVPASRHIRLGQGDLGDSPDRVPLSCDIRVHDHSVERHGRTKPQQAREELQRVVGYSVADEIEKLDRLKKSGAITDQEFTRLRAKLVG